MELLAKGTALAAGSIPLLDGLVGRVPGSVGETSAIALLLGGAFLLWRGSITWHVPVSFLCSVAAFAAVFSSLNPGRFPGAGFHLVAGGLVLGALFMATVTAPVTPRGMLIYGTGCGVLTWMIRSFGVYPEGVSFAILLMNMFTPLIDVSTRPCSTPKPQRCAGSSSASADSGASAILRSVSHVDLRTAGRMRQPQHLGGELWFRHGDS